MLTASRFVLYHGRMEEHGEAMKQAAAGGKLRTKLLVLGLGVAGLAFLLRAPISHMLQVLSVVPARESFTELYFVKRPTDTASGTAEFIYGIRNNSTQEHDYLATVSVLAHGKETEIDTRSLNIAPGGVVELPGIVPASPSFATSTIVVSLPELRESIHAGRIVR